MSYWVDMYMRHEQMNDRRQQATRNRLLRQARASNRPGRAYAPVMASLGRRLTLWGNRLETQYGL